jgi:hypothetical protein
MRSSDATEPQASAPAVRSGADAEHAAHRHGRSCFWRVEDARWSCDAAPFRGPVPSGQNWPDGTTGPVD